MRANEVPEVTPAPSTPATVSRKRVVVVGFGNDLLRDDAVGIHVARRVHELAGEWKDVTVRATTEMGLSLLDEIEGHEHLILIDSVVTRNAPAGFVHEFDGAGLRPRPVVVPHLASITDTLGLGIALGLAMPRTVRVFAIEVIDPFTVSTEMTPLVATAVEGTSKRVISWIRLLRSVEE